MHQYIRNLGVTLKKHGDPVNAVPMKKYMRDQFAFFGIQATERRALFKEYMIGRPLPLEKELRPIIMEMWKQPERDYQYCAIELLMKSKKMWKESDATLWEYLVTHKSWWDTVDYLANHVVGPWFRKFPEHIIPVTERWNQSENIWLQRMSILFQLKYKKDTDLDLLFKYIKHLASSKEFFVQKAIGWSLREYTKTDPKPVIKFLKENQVAPLSRREAMKRLNHKKEMK
jgi:3-methyladenine DNA glycosylase AlkD